MKLFLTKCIAILFLAGCSSLENLKTNFELRMLSKPDVAYIVKSGDSVWSIALKYNIDPQNIIVSNNLSKPFRIFPGEKLFLSEDVNNTILAVDDLLSSWERPIKSNKKPKIQGSYWLVFNEQKGSSIFAAQKGKVVVSGPDIPGYGNLVMISHPNGFISLYAHCQNIFVETGETVSQGMVIAQVGSSETSSPMLRFQLRKNGTPVKAKSIKF